MWGSTLPVIVFMGNRSVTRFFQAKPIPPALWNVCDYVLQENFIISHVADSMNTAADFLSRTEVNPVEKLEMSIRNDIQTRAIEVNIQSSAIVEEEQIYILPDDEFDENRLWEEKQIVKNQAQSETHKLTMRRTTPSLTWSQLKPSRQTIHHKDDTRSKAEILLPMYCKTH